MRVTLSFILALTAASAPAGAATETLCAKAQPTLPNLICVESARGVALAADRPRAETLLALAEVGADRFIARFGMAPVRYAVVEGADAPIGRPERETLRSAGFVNTMPWLSAKAYRTQVEASVRRAVVAQTTGQAPEVVEAATQQALSKLTAQFSPERRAKTDAQALPHELGHIWYSKAYWPNAAIDKGDEYGGPSPDWLDEMAAVLMEDPASFDKRVTQFGERYQKYRADPAKAEENVRFMIDLPHYFQERHPAGDAVRTLMEKQRAEGKAVGAITVLSGDEAKRVGANAERFYLQSAVAAQYLADRSGDPKVFGRIGAAFARGETIEQWLTNRELKGKLPRDINKMQADWLAWLDKKFPVMTVIS